MQENEFEKQVRELMDAFKLSPSEPVWEKIKRQIIKQKRKRRWIVLFFLFAGLIVSGYFMYNEWGRGGVVKERGVVKNEDEKSAGKNSVTAGKKRNEHSAANLFAGKEHQPDTSKKLHEEKIVTSNENH